MRIVLKPRGRPVDGEAIMAELFRLTDLEVRIGVNMNVLVDGTTPRVLDLKELLRAWLAHRREVLRRRSLHRRARIEQRLELLAGFLIVHLNLDEVIRIVREEDDPKQALMLRFALDRGAGRRGAEHAAAPVAQAGGDRAAPRAGEPAGGARRSRRAARRRGADVAADRRRGARRSASGSGANDRSGAAHADRGRARARSPAPGARASARRSRSPCCARRRAGCGRCPSTSPMRRRVRYKEGDRCRFVLHALSTDRLLIFGGERSLLYARLRPPADRPRLRRAAAADHRPAAAVRARLRFACTGRAAGCWSPPTRGRGFLVEEDEALGQTRAGKAVLLPGEGERAAHPAARSATATTPSPSSAATAGC